MASAPVGGTPIVRYLTIENGSPWLKGPIAISPNDVNYGTTNNGIVNYGYSGDGGEGFVQMPTQAGLLRLELDKGNPFILNGPPDFKVETVRTDNAPLFELQDRDLANQLNPVMWPMSPENGSTALNTDRVVLKITFTPNVVGLRQALLTIPSNDGSHPNLNITLFGSGTQSISN
jgi:hypothetical protein